MSSAATHLMGRAVELRLAFDRSFTEAIVPDADLAEDLLAITVGVEACALRLSEVAGLFADKKITRVPSGNAALLGIAGFRGTILPVFSLQNLLGHPGSQAPRWLVLVAGAKIALGFETFEGLLRVSSDAVSPEQSEAQARSFTRGFVQARGQIRPILHLPSVDEAIKRQRPKTLPKPEAAPKGER